MIKSYTNLPKGIYKIYLMVIFLDSKTALRFHKNNEKLSISTLDNNYYYDLDLITGDYLKKEMQSRFKLYLF